MDEKAPLSFPSHFVSQQTKIGRPWNLQQVKAMHYEGSQTLGTGMAVFKQNQSNYTRWRSYSRGEQDENQYKEMMGLKKEKGKFTESFRNLNFSILKVAPKIKSVLVNKVLNQKYTINVKPIDQASINDRHQYKTRLAEYISNQEEIQRFEMLTKLGLERPYGPGEIPPISHMEIDPWMEMHPKNAIAMEVKDYISWALYYNDWEQMKRELVGEVVDTGIMGTRQYLDSNGFVRVKRIIPDRCIGNKCIHPDFKDLIRFGEYYEITVSELRRITKGGLTDSNGKSGENAYRELADKVSGGTNKYNSDYSSYWNATTYTYAYDHEKVTIMDAMWYSDDEDVYVEHKNGAGNMRVQQKEYGWTPFKGDPSVNEGKGLDDKQFKEHYKGERQILRDRVRNVYKASWVVDTDYLYNYGLMDNMLRSVSSTGETTFPLAIVSTDFQSTMGNIEQALDQIQLQWLHFQSHSSASKPPGIAIEKRALMNVARGGKGGDKKWDPKEDLILWAELGSFVYDGYDAHGNPLNHLPFQELVGGLSKGAQEHFALIIQMIELIRNQLGLNALSEGANTPERMGKTVAQLSFGASDNALSHINDAFRQLYEKTCRNMVQLMQSSMQKINADGISEGLGKETLQFFKLNSDVSMRELGIMINEGPDEVLREKISAIVANAVAAKEISGENALYVELEENPYRALIMMKKMKREEQQRQLMQQQALMQTQGEENTKTAMAVEQTKVKAEADLEDKKRQNLILESGLRKSENAEKFLQDVALKKLEISTDMEADEKDFMLGVMEMNMKYALESDKIKQMAAAAAKKPKTKAA